MDVKVNTSELGKSFKRRSIWSNRGGVAGRGDLRAGEGWCSCRSLLSQSGPGLVEMRGWAESPRSQLDLDLPSFWSLLGTAWALLSYPGAVGDCRWQRFGEIGLVWKQIPLSPPDNFCLFLKGEKQSDGYKQHSHDKLVMPGLFQKASLCVVQSVSVCANELLKKKKSS